MKSIKLASGFAVSALALAIAGQATAQTQSSVSFSADLKVQTTIDLNDSTYLLSQPGLKADDEDWYNFLATWTVSHGPFSGRLRVGIDEDDASGNDGRDGEALVIVDRLLVTEGPVMFGQVGRVTATANLLESLTDENDLGGEFTGSRMGVDYGIRYTESDLGLTVQLEGARGDDDDFGVGAALYQDLDVAKFWVDGQFRVEEDANSTGMESEARYNVGVAIQATPVDQVTLTGVYRLFSGRTQGQAGADVQSVYAAKLDVAATDDVSLFALVTDRNANNQGTTGAANDTTIVRGGLTASVAPFVVEAGYEANFAELSEGLIFTSATWTDGPLSAFVGFDYAIDGFGDATSNGFELSFGGDFTSASGIVYGAEYTFSEDNGEFNDVSEIELFASYSF